MPLSFSTFRAKLSKRITGWVFLSLLAIEAVICIPSYLKFKHDQIAQREALITVSLKAAVQDDQIDLEMAKAILQHLRSQDLVLGGGIYTQQDRLLISIGPIPASINHQKRQFDQITNTYDSFLTLGQGQQSIFDLAIRYDATDIQHASWAYAIRMITMILIIAAVVTTGSMIGIERLVIYPILQLRQELLGVAKSLNSNTQCDLITSTQRRDELGDVIRAFEYLCHQTWQAVHQRERSHQAELIQRKIANKLSYTIEKINRQQAQLIQTEKLVSLGRLAGGMAHEINNPVTFIYSNIAPLQAYYTDLMRLIQAYQSISSTAEIEHLRQAIDLDFIQADLPQILASMQTGTQRIDTIVKALQDFSRFDQAGRKSTDITTCIDSTLILLQQRLRANSAHPEIQIIKEYASVPKIDCQPDLINQVFLSILNNAIDAIKLTSPRVPTIHITVTQSTQNILIISFTNNGPVLNEADLPKLFEPFFSTKEIGQGTGLSLFNSYQIICQQHSGQLTCPSHDPVTFVIKLPYDAAALPTPYCLGSTL